MKKSQFFKGNTILLYVFMLCCVIIFVSCNTGDVTEHVHEYGEYIITVSPTCTDEGEKQCSCSCGDVKTEKIPPEHSFTDENFCSLCYEMKQGTYTEGLEYQLHSSSMMDAYIVFDVGSAIEETEIVIPSYYQGKPVLAIEPGAFLNCTKMKSIVIPRTVVVIGKGAFSGCSSIETITMPTIGAPTTNDLDVTVGGVTFGSSVFGTVGAYFGQEPYKGGVLSQAFVYNVEKQNAGFGMRYQYYKPETLKTIILTGSSMGMRLECTAFDGLNLENLIIKESVGNYHLPIIDYFAPVFDAENVVIEENSPITEIGAHWLKRAKKVTLSKNVEILRENCFGVGLEEVVLPEALNTIGYRAFANCINLKEITLPAKLKSIGEEAFLGCENLKTIHNKSRLSITKGSKENGYVAYYASTITNN